MMSAAAESTYRMAEVVRRSGVTRETIHFYLREGLLPPARKTAHNAALYGDEHLHRLRLIRSLREEHLLPLKAIKSLLDDQPELQFSADQFATLQALRRLRLNDLRQQRPGGDCKTAGDLAGELGLTPGELQELRDIKLLTSADNEALDADEAECLRLWTVVRDAGINAEKGFSPRDIGYIDQAAKLLFEREVALFKDRVQQLRPAEIDSLLHTVIPAIHRLLVIRHERMISALLEVYGASAAQTTPSQEERTV
ncbi:MULTISPECIES: MerR family transcriptional regulator [Solimonas]|jgi:DNA-binding transcriptional MerR regulator|nr:MULTISPECIES: MerR family transcriptional regulator [Solimonas]MDM4771603.1 MerR family transcriptional regulator [Solimonas sp. SE-A11]HEX4895755.1 MerR family transcriptional regulator [Solimonas sp.]